MNILVLYLSHQFKMKGPIVDMIGRNHVICGISAAGLILSLDDIAARLVFHPHGWETPLRLALGFPFTHPVQWFLPGCLFLIGCVLPDIDSPHSLAGKFFHLPVQHRGITHTIWTVLFLCLTALAFHPMAWMIFGYLLHLFLDSVSVMGLLWTYPIRKYRVYGSGARVAPGHRLKLYHTGAKSEMIFAAVFVCVCLIGMSFWLYFREREGF